MKIVSISAIRRPDATVVTNPPDRARQRDRSRSRPSPAGSEVQHKRVQIHHIDGDPANNSPANLAVLCTECHDKTMLRGGFGRGLDADQIILYRDDWLRAVAQGRVAAEGARELSAGDASALESATSIAEIYREAREFELLAVHYNAIGNEELRDKYIEEALAGEPSDEMVIFLRDLQGRADLIPTEVVAREEERLSGDHFQLGRLYAMVGRHLEATRCYALGVVAALDEGRPFSAGYYLKELHEDDFVEQLFVEALGDAAARGDLWWQVRALQELGWDSELNDLLVKNQAEIEEARDPELQLFLARAKGDEQEVVKLQKQIAALTHSGPNAIYIAVPGNGDDAAPDQHGDRAKSDEVDGTS